MSKEAATRFCTAIFLATLTLSRATQAASVAAAGTDAPSAPPTRDSADDGADESDASPAPPATGTAGGSPVSPLRNYGEGGPPASEVKAQPLVDPFETRRLALEAHLGLATPVGTAGFIAEYSVLPFLGLGAGVGISPGNRENTVLGAIVARLRPLRVRQNALVIGTAYSFGRFHLFQFNIGDTPSETIGAPLAHFAQADIGWERRSPHGFLIRLGIGAAFLLNPSDLTCTQSGSPCTPPASKTLFTFDLALGYAF